MNGKIGMIAGLGAGVAVIGGLLYLTLAPVDVAEEVEKARAEKRQSRRLSDVETPSAVREKAKPERPAAARPSERKKATERKLPRLKVPADWYAKLPSEKDRGIAKRIQDAQDADDREAILAAAQEALTSKSAEVRLAAVDALSMQGEQAMAPLLDFVGDSDKGVAESAYHAWDDVVDNLNGDARRSLAVKDVLGRVKDEELVKSAVSKIESFDTPYAIRELARLAAGKGKAAEAARESYENVTGEPYESWEAAELKALTFARETADDIPED